MRKSILLSLIFMFFISCSENLDNEIFDTISITKLSPSHRTFLSYNITIFVDEDTRRIYFSSQCEFKGGKQISYDEKLTTSQLDSIKKLIDNINFNYFATNHDTESFEPKNSGTIFNFSNNQKEVQIGIYIPEIYLSNERKELLKLHHYITSFKTFERLERESDIEERKTISLFGLKSNHEELARIENEIEILLKKQDSIVTEIIRLEDNR